MDKERGYDIWEQDMDLLMELVPVLPDAVLLAYGCSFRHIIEDDITIMKEDELFITTFARLRSEIEARALGPEWDRRYELGREVAKQLIGPDPVRQVMKNLN